MSDPNTRVGSSAIFGMSIGAQAQGGRLGVSLFVRNLTNERVPLIITTQAGSAYNGDAFPPAKGDYAQNLGASSFRTIGLSLDWRL